MDEPIDVADCLRRWKSGDEGAAEALVRHLYPVICRIVRTHLSRRDHEEDLIQDVLMKTFSRLHQYRAEVPLAHWVSRLAVTTCLDRLRANKIRPEIRRSDLTREETDLFDAADWESRTKDAGPAIEARDLVDKLLSILSPEDRSLILMVDLEGRSLEEISDVTGWGVSKIKMRLFRVRGQLRKTMQKLEKQNE
jgi:RNA polymerase sigma factor (sigma-70 family)